MYCSLSIVPNKVIIIIKSENKKYITPSKPLLATFFVFFNLFLCNFRSASVIKNFQQKPFYKTNLDYV